eukprot:gene6802-9767_t
MPRALVYFLPQGSLHLRRRGWCGGYNIVFGEFRRKRHRFQLAHLAKLAAYALCLGQGLVNHGLGPHGACAARIGAAAAVAAVFLVAVA